MRKGRKERNRERKRSNLGKGKYQNALKRKVKIVLFSPSFLPAAGGLCTLTQKILVWDVRFYRGGSGGLTVCNSWP